MKFLIAGFSHETNTFSPVETTLERFCPDGRDLVGGETAVRFYRGTATCLGGFIAVAERAGAAIDLPVAAFAPPSRRVCREAYETIARAILEPLGTTRFDGLMLALHGAMVAEHVDDGEGELLARIRAIAPDVPIALALDMHANVSQRMVDLATVITGYHEYPHTDMGETGVRAGEILLAAISGEKTPVITWGRVPMLPHTMNEGTFEAPNGPLQGKAARLEAEGRVLAASVFTGFNLADVPDAALSVVVVTDDDGAGAQAMTDELLTDAWAARDDFTFDAEPLADSVARAKLLASDKGPVFLLDHCDNSASGGTMDTTAVLAEIIAQELEDAIFFGIYDPEAVEAAAAAGVGSTFDRDIGGKYAMPAIAAPSPSLRLKGIVRTVSDGVVHSRSKATFGLRMSFGRAVVIDTGRVEVVLVSKHVEPYGIDLLTTVGIDPRRRRFIALKSRHHWRTDLGPLAVAVVACAGQGVCTSDYAALKYHRLRRPIHPIDPGVTWSPQPLGAAMSEGERA